MRQGAHGSRALHVALGASIVVPAVAAAIAAAWPHTDAAGTRIALGDLRSRAAELALIARETEAGHLTDTYVRLQARQLADGVQSAADTLAQAPEAAAREAAAGAGRAQALTRRLAVLSQGAPRDQLPDLRDSLARASDGFRRLARALADR